MTTPRYSLLTENLMNSVSNQSRALSDIAAVMHEYKKEIPDHIVFLVTGVISRTNDQCDALIDSIEKELTSIKDRA